MSTACYSYLCPKLKLINNKKRREGRKKGRVLTYKGIIWATFRLCSCSPWCAENAASQISLMNWSGCASSEISLVSSLLNCDTSAHSLHAKKFEGRLILVSSMCAKFGVISWSFEWARANFTTEIRLHRIILPIFSDHAHITYRIWQHFHHDRFGPIWRISGTWPRHVSQPGIPSRIGRCKKTPKYSGVYFHIF